MKINKTIIFKIILVFMVLCTYTSKVYAVDTEYINKKVKEEKAIGLAVIKDDATGNTNYFYLYYDENGRAHIVEYVQNELDDEKKKKWILKQDADNAKARELGAKAYYTDEEDIKKDEKKDATKLYKKIVKKVRITTFIPIY